MKKLGFTLSEVLIALVIIGVLAAIVIPPMMNNTNEREFRTAAKKAISGLDRAIALEYALEGLTVQDYVSSEELVKYLFKKRMNNLEPSSKRFTNPDTCKDATPESIFNTADGMIYCVTNFKSDYSDERGSKCDFYNTTPCTKEEGPNIWIDVNGAKKPNKVTTSYKKPRDIYQAQLYSQKVLPYGDATQEIFYHKEMNFEKIEEDNNSNNSAELDDNQDFEDNNTPISPDNPYYPDDEDFEDGDDIPDEDNPYYDQYDPNKWPSWKDFLRWLLNWLKGLLT